MAATAISGMTRREELLQELARDAAHAPARVPAPPSDPGLAKLTELGTQIWLDTGNLDEASKLWRAEMRALTTNNTLANQVVQTGIMDETIAEAAKRIRAVEPGISIDDMVLDIVFVVNCQIAQRLVAAFDSLVSVELHPAVGHDIDATVRYAQRYYAVNPDRFIVKIPLTPEGFCSVARVRQEGIPINFTLGFSARQNYLAAKIANPNYVNVFLGRLNAVVADNKLGDGKFVGEKTTLASQKGVRELREQTTGNAVVTHQIAASMRSGEQMVTLAGVDVYTAPPKAVQEFFDAKHSPDDIKNTLDEQYEVKLGNDTDKNNVEVLWTIDDSFKAFASELASRGAHTLTGDDLRQADRDHGTKLFSGFTPEEQAEISKKGKIPDIARWVGRASLDDLMTESALQSFIIDQKAFDDRIRRIVAEKS